MEKSISFCCCFLISIFLFKCLKPTNVNPERLSQSFIERLTIGKSVTWCYRLCLEHHLWVSAHEETMLHQSSHQPERYHAYWQGWALLDTGVTRQGRAWYFVCKHSTKGLLFSLHHLPQTCFGFKPKSMPKIPAEWFLAWHLLLCESPSLHFCSPSKSGRGCSQGHRSSPWLTRSAETLNTAKLYNPVYDW